MTPFRSPTVAQAFVAYPPPMRRQGLALRELIFSTAAATPGVGELEETLKWGEPAYLTSASRSGSTIRIAWKPSSPTQDAMYFNCQTTLVDTFRLLFQGEFRFEGQRALVFTADEALPMDALAVCITAALTYRRDKAKAAAAARR